MIFAQPWALLGFLLFVPIILLYLLKQRRRRIEVSTLMFWDRILRDEQTVTSLTRLKKLLSLLLQLLFIALLTLATARPSLSGKLTGARRVVLLLDNSASMLVREGDRTRFDLARGKAMRVVRGMGMGDTMMIVAVAAETDIIYPFTDSKKDLQESIEKLQSTHGGTDFAKAVQLVEQLPPNDRETHVYLITDGAFEPPEIQAPAKTRFAYVRVGSQADNIGISAFSVRPLASSPRDFQVHVELLNDGDQERRVPLELKIGGRLVDAFEFSLPAGGSVTRTLRQFSAEGGEIEAVVDVADAFPLDNRAYATLPHPQRIRVRLVTPENLFLERALATDEDVDLAVVHPEKYAQSRDREGAVSAAEGDFAVTIFSGWHPNNVPAGNSIFIGNWPEDLGLKRRGEVAKPMFTEWQRDHPVNRHLALQNVSIEKAVAVERTVDFQELAASFNDSLVLLKETPGHKALIVTFDTSTTDLPLRIAFPIMVANAIRYLNGTDLSERWVSPQMGTILSSDDIGKYVNASNVVSAVLAPDGKRFPAGALLPVSHAGFYRAEFANGETNALFAANLSHGRECRIQPAEKLPLRAKGELSEIKQGFRLGFEPWVMLTFLAAALSISEWVLFHRRIIE